MDETFGQLDEVLVTLWAKAGGSSGGVAAGARYLRG
jgi:hypothetical protein